MTDHAAAFASKYVGEPARDYFRLLRAGLIGGALVAVFAVVKLLLDGLSLSPAAEAVLFSFNYSVCFVLIYALGGTLATKQPAFTAAAIAAKIDCAASHRIGLHEVARLVRTVWRNQFVSLVGNVIAALPLAVGLTLAIDAMLGVEVAGATKAKAVLADNHPLLSASLWFAAVAGLFLFVAGRVQATVTDRLRNRHAGPVLGNVLLGFLLGSAGTLGSLLGVTIDIRHVAFSSAHVGVASDASTGAGFTAVVLGGVLLIGLVNFAVSFGLTLVTSLRSRNVTFGEWRLLGRLLLTDFVREPARWFLPARAAGRCDNPCDDVTACGACA